MVYYVIQPNTELQPLLKQHPYIGPLTRFTEVEESESRSILGYSVSLEVQKLVFLAHLHSYLQILAHSEVLHQILDNETRQRRYDFLYSLLGKPPYTRILFDRWWIIERYELPFSYEETLKNLPLASLEALAETDSEQIAMWLKYQIQEKKDNQEE